MQEIYSSKYCEGKEWESQRRWEKTFDCDAGLSSTVKEREKKCWRGRLPNYSAVLRNFC